MASIPASKMNGLMTNENGSAERRSLNTAHAPLRAASSKHPANKTTSGEGVKRSLGATSDDNLGSEDDNSADEADEEEEDEPRVSAPSGGFGIGRGKRSTVRVEPADDDDSEDRGTGLDQESLLATPSKKRSFSNTGIFAAFDEEADSGTEKEKYPRKKLDRKLSNNVNGLLAYEGLRKGSTASEDAAPIVPESAIDSSDDDDEIYKAVEDIDESDNDEYIDETLEERALREALSNTSDNESDAGDGPDVSMLLETGYMEGNLLDMDNDQLLGLSSEHWGDMTEIAPVQSNTSTRRVRFDDNVRTVSDVDTDDDTSSEDLNSFFPDLFHRDNHLSGFRHSQELDDVDYFDESTASDSERSYWDFGDEKELSSDFSDKDHDVRSESGSESEAGSSGYETDEGDTTDEDLPPPPTIHKPSRVHRDSSSSAGSATPKPFPRSRKPPSSKSNKKRGPIKGFFTLDPKRAIAILDSTGKRMVLRPARVPDKGNQFWAASTASSTANNSPQNSLVQLNGDDSDFSDGNTNFADIMLSGIYGTAGSLNYPVGPPEAFYPFVGIEADGTVLDGDFDDDDDDDMEDMLDVNDFIDFGHSDSDEAEETDIATPTKLHAGHTPARQNLSAAHEMSQRMLQHFDRGNVTSFRRNQNRYRDVARLPDDPAARASASRPVRTGASADAIITPMRKKRKSNTPVVPRASPLARKSGPVAGTFAPRRP